MFVLQSCSVFVEGVIEDVMLINREGKSADGLTVTFQCNVTG